ncbi:hypothetical protein EYF80_052348 [Liparis tanakae]|uniref:Uncharacterized protein n=1 Tax=Liparis tanakae TaxID=230148 RepID=A0A4Z2F8K6_9TELE|nr:hypothetical protein EYF80_052348 [Liparis tanakae]
MSCSSSRDRLKSESSESVSESVVSSLNRMLCGRRSSNTVKESGGTPLRGFPSDSRSPWSHDSLFTVRAGCWPSEGSGERPVPRAPSLSSLSSLEGENRVAMAAVWRRKLSNLRDLSKRCRWRGLARPELPDAPASSRPPCPDAMHHRRFCPAGQELLLKRKRQRGDGKKGRKGNADGF